MLKKDIISDELMTSIFIDSLCRITLTTDKIYDTIIAIFPGRKFRHAHTCCEAATDADARFTGCYARLARRPRGLVTPAPKRARLTRYGDEQRAMLSTPRRCY